MNVMNIDLTFTLSTGGQYKNSVSDFATLDECRQRMAVLLEQDDDSITFEEPSGAMTVLASRHIVAVRFAPAGDR